MLHAKEIDLSEDDREALIATLEQVVKDLESKEREVASLLKKKTNMDPSEVKDLEKDKTMIGKRMKLVEEAMSKTERTNGHTLKKAYCKKTIEAIKFAMTETKFKEFEAELEKHGLVHHHESHLEHHHHHHHHGHRSAEAAVAEAK